MSFITQQPDLFLMADQQFYTQGKGKCNSQLLSTLDIFSEFCVYSYLISNAPTCKLYFTILEKKCRAASGHQVNPEWSRRRCKQPPEGRCLGLFAQSVNVMLQPPLRWVSKLNATWKSSVVKGDANFLDTCKRLFYKEKFIVWFSWCYKLYSARACSLESQCSSASLSKLVVFKRNVMKQTVCSSLSPRL